MRRKKVAVIASKWLAGGILDTLLSTGGKFKLHRLEEQTGDNLVAAIQSYLPDVVIVDSAIRPECLNQVFDEFATCPHMRVVMVSVEENWIKVFESGDFHPGLGAPALKRAFVHRRQKVDVKQPADFLAVL